MAGFGCPPRIQPALVFGVIERAGANYFNTAVVVRGGVLECAYRKIHLTAGECLFEPGSDYQTFDVSGVRCGINICYDTYAGGQTATPGICRGPDRASKLATYFLIG